MKKIGRQMIKLIKEDTVLCIAILLALVFSCIVPPDWKYLKYIDFKVLVLLFCLMLVVSGFTQLGVFKRVAIFLISKVKNYRQLLAVLLVLCFFSSMLITNDVALITFVPFAIMVLDMVGMKEKLGVVIVLQTIAANLGSMFTPIGNPQNLYLYEKSQMSIGDFLAYMFPITAVSLLLLLFLCLLVEKRPVEVVLKESETADEKQKKIGYFIFYCILFILSILTVLRVLHYGILFIVTIIGIFCFKRELFKKVDYSLLLTFVGFFIFIGNLGRIEVFREFLQKIMDGREMVLAFLCSQIMSNVPAAVLLSEFTNEWGALLKGINIGGLGTLIASMASVISFKLYSEVEGVSKKQYLIIFTGYSIVFASALFITVYLIG